MRAEACRSRLFLVVAGTILVGNVALRMISSAADWGETASVVMEKDASQASPVDVSPPPVSVFIEATSLVQNETAPSVGNPYPRRWSQSSGEPFPFCPPPDDDGVVRERFYGDIPAREGMLFMKLMKVGGSTAAGVNLRIAHHMAHRLGRNYTHCNYRFRHSQAFHHMRYAERDRDRSFLWSLMRDPTNRAVSEFFHFHVSRKSTPVTPENFIGVLEKIKPQYAVRELNTRSDRVTNGTVADIFEDYDFIAVTERMQESMVVLMLLLDLPLSDILYLSSKGSGGYDGGGNGKCVFIQPSWIPPEVQQYLDGPEWQGKSRMDRNLWEEANRRLDDTIQMLGPELVASKVVEYREALAAAKTQCLPLEPFPCSSNGVYQSENDCYAEDVGCGKTCLDAMSNEVVSPVAAAEPPRLKPSPVEVSSRGTTSALTVSNTPYPRRWSQSSGEPFPFCPPPDDIGVVKPGWHGDTPTKEGMLFMKLMKVGGSTAAGVNLRIAHRMAERLGLNYTHCNYRFRHSKGHDDMHYDERDRDRSFLWTLVRDPTKRAISEFFHFDVSRRKKPVLPNIFINTLRRINPQYAVGELNTRTSNLTDPGQAVADIFEDYDFIAVTERMQESLVVLMLLLDLPMSDILYLSSKGSGGYDDGATGHCVLIQPSWVPPEVQEYLDGPEWQEKTHYDRQLWEEANQRLDATIEALGSQLVESKLREYREALEQATARCLPLEPFPCTKEGVLQKTNDCYAEDAGCGKTCLDALSQQQGDHSY